MKKLRLDFNNRIVNIVTDQKTVIAYMDEELEKHDFKHFFPDDFTYDFTDNVTFDFENSLLCLKKPVKNSDEGSGYRCVKRISVPAIKTERHNIMNAIGWDEK